MNHGSFVELFKIGHDDRELLLAEGLLLLASVVCLSVLKYKRDSRKLLASFKICEYLKYLSFLVRVYPVPIDYYRQGIG